MEVATIWCRRRPLYSLSSASSSCGRRLRLHPPKHWAPPPEYEVNLVFWYTGEHTGVNPRMLPVFVCSSTSCARHLRVFVVFVCSSSSCGRYLRVVVARLRRHRRPQPFVLRLLVAPLFFMLVLVIQKKRGGGEGGGDGWEGGLDVVEVEA